MTGEDLTRGSGNAGNTAGRLPGGIITPTVTPLRDGELDGEGIAELLEFLRRSGVVAAFPAGSLGMFHLLSLSEHKRLISEFASRLPSGMALLPGVHRGNLEDTVEVARHARDVGAAAVVAVPPFYYELGQEEIADYYLELAGAADVPVIIYNIPQMARNRIDPETAANVLSRTPMLAGVKDSSRDLATLQGYISALPGIPVYEGQDDLLLAARTLGASGGVCGTSNFVDMPQRIWSAGAGEALALQRRLSRLMRLLSRYEFPSAYYYLFQAIVMDRRNPTGYMPRPMRPLDGRSAEALLSEFRSIVSGSG
ncbi:MAG: dihydrodipicolinate synthase family protein [Conexivisphaera sp.]